MRSSSDGSAILELVKYFRDVVRFDEIWRVCGGEVILF